jgi:hypothetical protein
MSATAPTPSATPKHRTLAVFAWGLGVRLVGGAMIWAGDGHRHWISKVVVVIGIVLSIGGIGVLKWLAMQPRRRRERAATPGKDAVAAGPPSIREAEWRDSDGRPKLTRPTTAPATPPAPGDGASNWEP